MRTVLSLLLVIVILGRTSAGPRQRPKKRFGRKHNAFEKGTQHRSCGILKRLDTMDDHFSSLGVQIADMLENKEHINSQLSEIKNVNLDGDEKMDKAISRVNGKMDDMNRNINIFMNSLLKSMQYMNDTMQDLQTVIKTNKLLNNVKSLGGLGNRGEVA